MRAGLPVLNSRAGLHALQVRRAGRGARRSAWWPMSRRVRLLPSARRASVRTAATPPAPRSSRRSACARARVLAMAEVLVSDPGSGISRFATPLPCAATWSAPSSAGSSCRPTPAGRRRRSSARRSTCTCRSAATAARTAPTRRSRTTRRSSSRTRGPRSPRSTGGPSRRAGRGHQRLHRRRNADARAGRAWPRCSSACASDST